MSIELNNRIFESFPELESERLILRRFETHDAENYFEIRSNSGVMEFMDAAYHKSPEESKDKILEIHKDFEKQEGINWAISEKGSTDLIGYIGFFRMEKDHFRAEVGYALMPAFWGKGYMKESLLRILDFAFNEFGLNSIEANVNPKNSNSYKLLERIGFKREAYFTENYFHAGKFLDSAIYCILKSDLKN